MFSVGIERNIGMKWVNATPCWRVEVSNAHRPEILHVNLVDEECAGLNFFCVITRPDFFSRHCVRVQKYIM